MSNDPRAPIRVLLVDDSAVIRRFVTETLELEPDIVIASTAANGQLALDKIEREHPDVVVLDVEMPVLDGLSTLKQLRPRWPDIPVVMYSTLTQRGATATLDALALGATDYVLKPSQLGDQDAARHNVLKELAPIIRSWGNVYRARRAGTRPAAAAPAAPVAASKPKTFQGGRPDVVLIGSSTGGPQALTEVIPNLPANLHVPVLVVQHMPPLFTKLLAERLAARSPLPVVEADAGMVVEPGHVYIARGGIHMVAGRNGTAIEIGTDDGPPENSCKPAVDVMFRSALGVWGAKTMGVILTGMGQDGLAGCKQIVTAGGPVIVQDERTSVVWGMPGAVARAGIAHEILPLADIAPAITRHLSRSLARASA